MDSAGNLTICGNLQYDPEGIGKPHVCGLLKDHHGGCVPCFCGEINARHCPVHGIMKADKLELPFKHEVETDGYDDPRDGWSRCTCGWECEDDLMAQRGKDHYLIGNIPYWDALERIVLGDK